VSIIALLSGAEVSWGRKKTKTARNVNQTGEKERRNRARTKGGVLGSVGGRKPLPLEILFKGVISGRLFRRGRRAEKEGMSLVNRNNRRLVQTGRKREFLLATGECHFNGL